jgi:hypothetical protein
MNSELTSYLEALGAPEALRARIDDLVGSYETVLEEDVGAWFVSEYLEEGGERTFESLWLFTETYLMEAELLGAEEDHFDFVPFKAGITRIAIDKRSFNLKEPTAASRMTVETWMADRQYSVMRATGDNCAALLEILQTVLLPNT